MGMFKDVKNEYSKVQWPKRREVVAATTWVVVMSIILILYLGVFDIIASRLIALLVSCLGG